MKCIFDIFSLNKSTTHFCFLSSLNSTLLDHLILLCHVTHKMTYPHSHLFTIDIDRAQRNNSFKPNLKYPWHYLFYQGVQVRMLGRQNKRNFA